MESIPCKQDMQKCPHSVDIAAARNAVKIMEERGLMTPADASARMMIIDRREVLLNVTAESVNCPGFKTDNENVPFCPIDYLRVGALALGSNELDESGVRSALPSRRKTGFSISETPPLELAPAAESEPLSSEEAN